jgi:hypothetical protein
MYRKGTISAQESLRGLLAFISGRVLFISTIRWLCRLLRRSPTDCAIMSYRCAHARPESHPQTASRETVGHGTQGTAT